MVPDTNNEANFCHHFSSVPGLGRGSAYFTYAAKGHGCLSRRNELLVTYIINASHFWDMVADAEIYRPRFVRIVLDGMVALIVKVKKEN